MRRLRSALPSGSLRGMAVGFVVGAALVGLVVGAWPAVTAPGADPGPSLDPSPSGSGAELATFESADAFRQYVRDNGAGTGYSSALQLGGNVAVPTSGGTAGAELDAGGATGFSGADDGGAAPRYSDTNVQEAGIAEPDLLKTDGESVFYSARRGARPLPRPAAERRDVANPGLPYQQYTPETHVLDASDPAAPERIAGIEDSGSMFLTGDTLVVLGDAAITGYDVSSPETPSEEWQRNVSGRVVTARQAGDVMYLVVQQRARTGDPCPIEPYRGASVSCTDVHRPTEPTRADSTTTVLSVRPDSGEVLDTASFVGSYSTSAVYVSEGSVYVTFPQQVDAGATMLDFLRSDAGSEHVDAETVSRLDRLAEYELSTRATEIEVREILEEYVATLDEDRQSAVLETIWTEYREYLADRKRELTRTGIVRVDTGTDGGDGSDGGELDVAATGAVPGRVLDQFSMDERDDHLRIATTIPGHGGDSENDVYVLDSELSVTGSVQGMGLDERIYSVRFLDDEGYVVTFRQIDPFHVLDLSDPDDPTLEGELKLPGFSSYLHPLAEDRVLGIGEEDGQVKAVTFDVSDPTDPTVEDDVILEDSWSAVRESHHAFLQDERHEVFFLPGSEGGHVFSYADGGIERVTTVETPAPPNRAMYVDDHLYVFSEEGLVVVDETDWSEETRLSFAEDDGDE